MSETAADAILAILAEQDEEERAEEMRLAAIQTASDQVPTVMADWPAGTDELELRVLSGDR